MNFLKKIDWENILIIASYGFVLCLLVVYSYYKSFNFDGIAIDGTFQHLNPLRRIENGEIAGLNFPVFHGMFFMYFAYPIYQFLGGNLFSAEFSKYFLNGLFFLVTNFFIFKFFFTSEISHKLNVLFIFLLFIIKSLFINEVFYSMWFLWLLDPINDAYSTSNIRILIPSINIFVIYYLFKYKYMDKENNFILFLLPLISFSAYLFSTEQGLSLIVSVFISIVLVLSIKKKFKKLVLFIIIYILILSFLFILVKNLIFDFGLNYLNELVKDQYWFFGAPPANLISLDFSMYEQVIFIKFFIAIFLSILAFIILFKKYYFEFLLLFIYGLTTNISMLGMASTHYVENFLRISVLLFLISLIKYFNLNIKNINYSIYIFILVVITIVYSSDYKKIIKLQNINYSHNINLSGVNLSDKWNYTLEKESKYVNFDIEIKNYNLLETTNIYIDEKVLDSFDIRIGDKLQNGDITYNIIAIDYTKHFITIDKAIDKFNSENLKIIFNRDFEVKKIFTDTRYEIDNNVYNGIKDFLYENKSCFYTNQIYNDIRKLDILTTSSKKQFTITSTDRNYICIDGKLNHYLDGYPNKIELTKSTYINLKSSHIKNVDYFTYLELPKNSFIRLVDLSDKITINDKSFDINFVKDNKIYIKKLSDDTKNNNIIFNNMGNTYYYEKLIKVKKQYKNSKYQFLIIDEDYIGNIKINDQIKNAKVIGKYENIIMLDKFVDLNDGFNIIKEDKNKIEKEYTVNDKTIFKYEDGMFVVQLDKINISKNSPIIIFTDYLDFYFNPIKIVDNKAYFANIPGIIERINISTNVKVKLMKEEINLLDIKSIVNIKNYTDQNWIEGVREDNDNIYYYVDMDKKTEEILQKNRKIFDFISGKYYEINILKGNQISISKKQNNIEEKIFSLDENFYIRDEIEKTKYRDLSINYFENINQITKDIFQSQIVSDLKTYNISSITDQNWKNGISKDLLSLTINEQNIFLPIEKGSYITINKDKKLYKVVDVYKTIITVAEKIDISTIQSNNSIVVYPKNIPLTSDIVNNKLIEDYTGLLSLLMKQNNPTNIDYIIHALGEYRNKYNYINVNYKDIGYFNILSNEYIPHALWLRYTYWEYYKDILNNFSRVTKTHHSELLKKFDYIASIDVINNSKINYNISLNNKEKGRENWINIGKQEGNNLKFNSYKFSSNKLYEIKFKYNINNLISKLPIIGKSPRVFLYPQNEVWNDLPYTIDINKDEMIVPYFSKSSEPLELLIKTYPKIGNLFTISFESIEIREVNVNNYNLLNEIFIK